MGQRPGIVTRRRNNAPIRPQRRRRAPAVPALVLAAAVAFLTVAVALGLASFTGSDLTAGQAGPTLARLLALAALVTGVLGTLVAVLMAGKNATTDALAPATIVGVAIGGVQSIFLFIPVTGPAIALPWLLLPAALPAITARILRTGARR